MSRHTIVARPLHPCNYNSNLIGNVTSIDWTDETGAASLTNGKSRPGDRFSNWNPRSVPFGVSVNTLAGDLIVFEDREDHSASFEIPGIPYASLDLMLRLQNHLEGGGTVQVTTGDSASRVYPTCSLAPGADVSIDLTDKVTVEYTVAFNLLNVAGSRVQMLAIY